MSTVIPSPTIGVTLHSNRPHWRLPSLSRLREVDIKAEHFERQVQRLEQEREEWEKAYEVRSSEYSTQFSPLLMPQVSTS